MVVNRESKPMRYESTIQSETGRCDCGVRVDEGDNYGMDGEWLCPDCHAEQTEAGEEQDAIFNDEPLSLAKPVKTDWLKLAGQITDPDAYPFNAGVW
jgi:hypothetical protein